MTIKSKITKRTLTTLEKITGEKLTFGKLLWAIRMSEEWAQVEFADKLGISKQQLCDLEHDRKSVSPKLAATYAKKLGFSQEQFIRLSLQNMLDRAHLAFSVEILPAATRAM